MMVNWANIQNEVREVTMLTIDQASIEDAINSIEKEYTQDELFLKEADDLEQLLIQSLIKDLQKNRGREIKRRQLIKEKSNRQNKMPPPGTKVGVKVLPFGNLKDLKDMGVDPEMMEQISKSMMEQLFGKRPKKKDKDDDDDDEDPGASFYM